MPILSIRKQKYFGIGTLTFIVVVASWDVCTVIAFCGGSVTIFIIFGDVTIVGPNDVVCVGDIATCVGDRETLEKVELFGQSVTLRGESGGVAELSNGETSLAFALVNVVLQLIDTTSDEVFDDSEPLGEGGNELKFETLDCDESILSSNDESEEVESDLIPMTKK